MNWNNILLISLAVSSISITITKSSLFNKIRPKWKLFNCPYCLSHWISFLFILLLKDSGFLNFIILSFSTITLANIFSIPLMYFLNYVDSSNSSKHSTKIGF